MRLWKTAALILAISLTGTLGAGARAATASPADPSFRPEVDRLMKAYVDTDAFSGSVLVALDGKVLYRRDLGLANRELDVVNGRTTKYRIGSLTKPFTAAAILQLVEQGKIGLDEPIGKYYPAAPSSWSAVTIRMLLSHRSGIYNYTDEITPASLPWFQVARSPNEIAALAHDKPLQFAPGAEFRYSNTNYVLLGIVIEKASGQRYADYLRTHIFTPLGMSNTGYDDTNAILANRADGYSKGRHGWGKAMALSLTVPYAAGGLYSTVDDLLIWDEALHSGKVVGRPFVEAMFADNGGGYGLGYQVGVTPEGRPVLSHAGGIPGFAAALQRLPRDRLTVIVLANQDNAPSPKIAGEIGGLFHGVAPVNPPVVRAAVTLPPEVLDRYVGSYALAPGVEVTIVRKEDRMFATLSGKGQTELFAERPGRLFSRNADVRFVFETAPDHRVTSAMMVLEGRSQPMTVRTVN